MQHRELLGIQVVSKDKGELGYFRTNSDVNTGYGLKPFFNLLFDILHTHENSECHEYVSGKHWIIGLESHSYNSTLGVVFSPEKDWVDLVRQLIVIADSNCSLNPTPDLTFNLDCRGIAPISFTLSEANAPGYELSSVTGITMYHSNYGINNLAKEIYSTYGLSYDKHLIVLRGGSELDTKDDLLGFRSKLDQAIMDMKVSGITAHTFNNKVRSLEYLLLNVKVHTLNYGGDDILTVSPDYTESYRFKYFMDAVRKEGKDYRAILAWLFLDMYILKCGVDCTPNIIRRGAGKSEYSSNPDLSKTYADFAKTLVGLGANEYGNIKKVVYDKFFGALFKSFLDIARFSDYRHLYAEAKRIATDIVKAKS